MEITKIQFHRFKKFRDTEIDIGPGVSLVAGGNNCGKSSLLQGLAIWEFCKTVLEIERGKDSLCAGRHTQGIGMADDEFTPVNLPGLNHLWTNLKAQKEEEPDGYTLWVTVDWVEGNEHKSLCIGLSLVNDRLFIKQISSTVAERDPMPRIAFVPSFAGISDREARYTKAIRRRYIGQGLSGAVLRNILLDLYQANLLKRQELRRNGGRIADLDLAELRSTDPFERLQVLLQRVFSRGLKVHDFNDLYHSYITVSVFRGEVHRNRFRRIPNYKSRDLMVEGSGFLQWLTVLALTLDPEIDVVLLDEPDAHLHPALQQKLLSELDTLSEELGKQIIYATHSSELIKCHDPSKIINANLSHPKYLTVPGQKIGLLAGLGSEYTPRFHDLERKRRILFVENDSDYRILKILADKIGTPLRESFVEWPWSGGHKERKHLHLQLRGDVPDLVSISLVDRDLQSINSVRMNLSDKAFDDDILHEFYVRTWRRRNIEGYLLHPDAIARAAGVDPQQVIDHVRQHFAIDISHRTVDQTEPDALLQADAKAMFLNGPQALERHFRISRLDVASNMLGGEVAEDMRMLINEINTLLSHVA